MSSEVYYFSATGNSLAAARDIAAGISGSLIPMASVIENERITTSAEVVGFVFPVYFASLGGSGIPLIVERFVGKLELRGKPYIFAVCTHRGGPYATLENLDGLLQDQGQSLAGGFTARMSDPPSVVKKLFSVFTGRKVEADMEGEEDRMLELQYLWDLQCKEIVAYIEAGRTGTIETTGPVKQKLLKPYLALQYRMGRARYRSLAGEKYDTFKTLIPLSDKGFRTSETCTGCGTCAKVCPVENIRIKSGKPVWLHRCESCYACFQWCPNEAITGDMPKYEKKYHHPSVTLKDMLR